MTEVRKAIATMLVPFAAAIAVGGSIRAQDEQQEEYVRLRDKKMALDVFQRNGWTFDYDAARARANREGKIIFAYFTRSYKACRPCTAFENGTLSDARFAEFGKQVVLFCHVTSHVETDAHRNLLSDKGGSAFPYLAFLTEDGSVLAAPRDRRLASLVKTRNACAKYRTLAPKLEAGDKSVGADVLIARIEMGRIKFAEAREAEMKLEQVTTEKRAKLRQLIVNLEVSDGLRRVRTREQAVAVGKQFQKMLAKGRVPKGESTSRFFALIMEAAYDQGDAKAYERAFKVYEKVAPQGRNRARVLDRLRARLDELKKRLAA